MASRTQIVCLCEGKRGDGSGRRTSIDLIFINRLMKSLEPGWLRPWPGSNVIRLAPCGDRGELIKKLPDELRACIGTGSDTTLMVWADCDDDCADPEALKKIFWDYAQDAGITQSDFDRAVLIFAKDRIENWIEFLSTGATDESREGPRARQGRGVAEAAKRLAEMCRKGDVVSEMPPSLRWSCKNWRALVDRMRA